MKSWSNILSSSFKVVIAYLSKSEFNFLQQLFMIYRNMFSLLDYSFETSHERIMDILKRTQCI